MCQPYSIELLASDAADLFTGTPSGDSIDLRHDEARARFEAAMVRSLAPVPPLLPPAVPETNMSTPVVPPAMPSQHNVLRGALVTTSDGARASTPSATLPDTGIDHKTLLTAASMLLVAGVATVASARGERAASGA